MAKETITEKEAIIRFEFIRCALLGFSQCKRMNTRRMNVGNALVVTPFLDMKSIAEMIIIERIIALIAVRN